MADWELDETVLNGVFAGVSPPIVSHKGWGREIIFANTAQYAGKVLAFIAGGRMSLHFHVEKREHWYVLEGSFALEFRDTKTGKTDTVELLPGDCWFNPQGFPHRLTAGNRGGKILEVSTRDIASDNYRISPGDSQGPAGPDNYERAKHGDPETVPDPREGEG